MLYILALMVVSSCGSQMNDSIKEEEVSKYAWEKIDYLQRYDRFENSEVICYGNIRSINCKWK